MENEQRETTNSEPRSPISKEIADLMQPYCDEYDFDPDLCSEIEGMAPLHAFIVAYGYLSTEDLDAEKILGEFIEQVGLKK